MGVTKRPGSALSLEAKLTYAGNPLTPPAVLDILAMDEDWVARRRLASHPGLSQSAFLILSRDPHPEVQMGQPPTGAGKEPGGGSQPSGS